MTCNLTFRDLLILATVLLPRSGLGQTLVRAWFGGAPGALGEAGIQIGDVDGDGYTDVFLTPYQHPGFAYTASAYSGRTGAVLWTSDVTGFWVTSETRGDVNGDGVSDPLVLGWGTATPQVGENIILDGATGVVLRRMFGAVPNQMLWMRYGGDMDADGREDLMVTDATTVRWISGRSGAVIHTHVFSRPYPAQLYVGRACGDLNGDGYDDFLLEYAPNVGNSPASALDLVSGRTGQLLQTYSNPANVLDGWSGLVPIGDFDGDMLDDFATSAPFWEPSGYGAGYDIGGVWVYSSAQPAPLAAYTGQFAGARYGTSISAAGDIDGDGKADVLVGAPNDGFGSWPLIYYVGSLNVIYGGGQPSLRLMGTQYGQVFGSFVTKADDLSGDGLPDVVVGAIGDNTGGPNYGAVHAFSLPGLLDASQVTVVGHACTGSTIADPCLRAYGTPRVGAAIRFGMRGAPPGAASVLIMGNEQPLPLDFLGAPGCVLYSTLGWTGFLFADPSGRAFHPVILPANPSLIGVQQTLSWLVFDAPANQLGVTLSNGLRLRVGG